MNRRAILKKTGVIAGGSLVSFLNISELQARSAVVDGKVKIVVAGGHPDDPETGCGGSVAWLTSRGHQVISLYITTGEAGIPGTSHQEAAKIREREAREASRILGAEPVFFGQIDGDTYINREAYDKMQTLIGDMEPDMIFTQWPVDTHRDHRVASLLIYDAWLALDKRIPLYYYEVLTGNQTQAFRPTDYIDISSFAGTKKKACFKHKSQKPEEWYHEHEEMSLFRGKEAGCVHAEAFIGHPHNSFPVESE